MNEESLTVIQLALKDALDVQGGTLQWLEQLYREPGIQPITEKEAMDMNILRQRIVVIINGLEVINAELSALAEQEEKNDGNK